jgi:hypothetical protein
MHKFFVGMNITLLTFLAGETLHATTGTEQLSDNMWTSIPNWFWLSHLLVVVDG